MKGRDKKYIEKEKTFDEKLKPFSQSKRVKQWRMLKLLDRFEFKEDISDKEIFQKFENEDILIKHKVCGKEYASTLNNFYKVKPAKIKVLTPFVKEKVDLNCPHCLQDANNQYIKGVIDKKTNKKFILLDDYIDNKMDVTLEHLVCKNKFKINSWSIINSNTIKCPCCSKALTNDEKRKQRNLIKFKEEFVFDFDIENCLEFKENVDKTIRVKHKVCDNDFDVNLSSFNNINMGTYKHLKDFLKTEYSVKCPHCLQEAKNKYFQHMLDQIEPNEYTLSGDYESIRKNVNFIHNRCGGIISVNGEMVITKKKVRCIKCFNSKEFIEAQQIERNKEFNKELSDRGLVEFRCIGDYKNRLTKTLFHHETCGHEFEEIPENFLKRVNKCPNCDEYKRVVFKEQEDRNDYFQSELNEKAKGFLLRGDYLGRSSDVTLYHEGCKKEFTMVSGYFVKSNYRCPHCQTKRYKYGVSLSIKDKIKCFEEEIGPGYKILEGFTNNYDEVRMRHLSCGREFTKKISLAINRPKNSMLCPHCEVENRKNIFMKKLKDRFNGKYILIGEYVNGDTETEFRHLSCMKVFKSTPSQVLERKLESCPHCNILVKNREKKFKEKLYKKFGAEYSLLGEYVTYDEKILFKHKSCGEMFWERPNRILKKDIPCPLCSKKQRILPKKEVLSRIYKYNGDMFRMCGEYLGTEKKVPFICNKCSGVFEVEPCRLFRRKLCPHCGKRHVPSR